jgi:hypothetical protein
MSFPLTFNVYKFNSYPDFSKHFDYFVSQKAYLSYTNPDGGISQPFKIIQSFPNGYTNEFMVRVDFTLDTCKACDDSIAR